VETFRWFTLWAGAMVAGVMAYVLVGQERMVDVAVLAGMAAATAWVILGDREVDSYRP